MQMICSKASECSKGDCSHILPHDANGGCTFGGCLLFAKGSSVNVACVEVDPSLDFDQWWDREYGIRMKGSKYLARKAWSAAIRLGRGLYK